MDPANLPQIIKESPHWRILIRPDDYKAERIATRGDCKRLIEQTHVSLRGWDFPHLSHRSVEVAFGADFVASWSTFMGHQEYWRLYQSGQFIYLGSVREKSEALWDQKLRDAAKWHLGGISPVPLDDIPGFISIVNALYTVVEVYEFAARLCQREVFTGAASIEIGLHNVRGFALMTELNRAWHAYFAASEPDLAKAVECDCQSLVADVDGLAVSHLLWLFECFGWTDPSRELLEKEVRKFRASRA